MPWLAVALLLGDSRDALTRAADCLALSISTRILSAKVTLRVEVEAEPTEVSILTSDSTSCSILNPMRCASTSSSNGIVSALRRSSLRHASKASRSRW